MQRELKLLVYAIKGYRSVFNHVFALAGTDLAAKRILSRMFSSFEKTCPRREVKPPKQDLSMVHTEALLICHMNL